MSYQHSRARSSLKTEYAAITSTLRTLDRGQHDSAVREYVISAAIFIAHAVLENYISDVFSAYAIAACAQAKNGSQLPEHLRSHLFSHRANLHVLVGNVIGGKSEEALLKPLASALKGPAGSLVNDGAALPIFNGKDIYTNFKYPSAKNLRKLFFRIGVENVFDRASALLKQDSSALLESLGSLRTQLAHTGSSPGVSTKDVRERLKDCERFVGAVDRILYGETSKCFGLQTWRTHVC